MVGSEPHPARAARNTGASHRAILPGPTDRISLLYNANPASVHVTNHSAKDDFHFDALILGIERFFADSIRERVCGIAVQRGIIKISPGYRALLGAKCGAFHDSLFQDGVCGGPLPASKRLRGINVWWVLPQDVSARE